MVNVIQPTTLQRVETYIEKVKQVFPQLDFTQYEEKVVQTISAKENMSEEKITNALILAALDYISMEEPAWTFVAANVYLDELYRQASMNRGYNVTQKYGSFYELIQYLTSIGIYSEELTKAYSKEEIDELQNVIDSSCDQLFTYIGLLTLADRYLAKSHDKKVYELPQERFLVIAMTLMMKEDKTKRINLIKEAYWAMSNLYMTVATPTLANAGKSYGQLSSCFIDTVEDSLEGIYHSNTDSAKLSKFGGGIGVYVGKIRSLGSDIRGFKGNSSGIVPWIKQINNTAVSVDQLGQRQGAIAVYYNVFGKDIMSFLDLRLNNGDERLRAHDIFTGVCIPDNFMRAVENREPYYLFDPHPIKKNLGFELDDFFDAKELQEGEAPNAVDHAFTYHYNKCVEAAKDGLLEDGYDVVPAIDIMKRIMISQLETGTPYMFYRDTVNRGNANSHKGMIYCSNLCTEIAQNMSATTVTEEYVTEDGKVVTVRESGDYVVCNLSSINLARTVSGNVLPRLISIQVRMLDNVIELNTIPVLQAQVTNQKYRGIGLGTFGFHHLLALKGITWESEEAVQYVDDLYEEIAYHTIQASMELAKEKGAYPVFKGSAWETGHYFTNRGYDSEEWDELRHQVKTNGIRNGYLMAVAPNSSTSIIAGSTASIDPIFRKFYSEEKKNYKIPVTAPDLNEKTNWYYKSVYFIDQKWSIKQNSKRQRHIDQSVSFNLYIRNDIRAKDLLDLHVMAWKEKLKTTYYVRSTSNDVLEECESCHS
ncbi:ribonucleoside-diphosphate reductase subunit alpha [Metabacillus iocasae]|uniref:Ribonucleoside-diphosphate reductase n=1 Tax=Priestia iocasae TaxID=2291674 RepID=A0ABS2QZA7_9BACI|nr:ribonucleoside-diphosphate reductase subunit alpha [Metabacillus iocasae]MBM7704815.1 ribonucleoside-diphosphate reductase alpha chain [Metabacillus iocasae]